MHQKDNPHKPMAKVKRITKEIQIVPENKKKFVIDFPRNDFKRKNKVEERALGLGVKKEQESTYLRA